jgi:hypothetical protein
MRYEESFNIISAHGPNTDEYVGRIGGGRVLDRGGLRIWKVTATKQAALSLLRVVPNVPNEG